jgi:DNA-binding CsgD family transcriptional regulator
LRAAATGLLLAHQPAAAAELLRVVWDACETEGVNEPGVFPVAPDLVQALIEGGDVDQAAEVTTRLASFVTATVHPWASVTARRCSSLVMLATADGDHSGAAQRLADASDAYQSLGLTYDAARCLLSLGRAQRRLRQWGLARDALQRAIVIFDRIGSPGWADAARAELVRTGVRGGHSAQELTPAEQRAAELAVAGLSNKEIARTLVVTVHTVEVHLSRVYAKLGVPSRGRLAAQLRSPDTVEH